MRSGSLLNLGLKYTVFAIIAISINIFFQELTYNIYTGPFALEASMVCGVFVGFKGETCARSASGFCRILNQILLGSQIYILLSFHQFKG